MKPNDLQDILARLQMLDYQEDLAKFVRVGPYRIHQTSDLSWELTGDDSAHIFGTRMAAMGYAKCLLDNDITTAARIVELDEQAGATRSHVESIKQAAKNNDQIGAKEQQAEQRHRANMQLLAQTVLDLI